MRKIMMSLTEDCTIKEVYEKFIISRKATNVSKETVSYYGYCFQIFSEFVGKDCLAGTVNSELMNQYVNYLLQRETICETTVNTYLR